MARVLATQLQVADERCRHVVFVCEAVRVGQQHEVEADAGEDEVGEIAAASQLVPAGVAVEVSHRGPTHTTHGQSRAVNAAERRLFLNLQIGFRKPIFEGHPIATRAAAVSVASANKAGLTRVKPPAKK